jgi:hypothetical protein
MIVCKELNKEYSTKAEMFKALRENKSIIIADKKALIQKSSAKNAGISCKKLDISKFSVATKCLFDTKDNYYLAVNTTGVLDSHDDLHKVGIWNKTVQDQQGKNYLVTDHKMEMANVVVKKENVKMFTAIIPFSSIGKNYSGDTQALIYEFKKSDIINDLAKEWLESGDDIEASVRMQYVKIELALNSTDKNDIEEFKIYNENIESIANKDDFDVIDYFWVVSEAKNIGESSLVLRGSNGATGLLGNKNIQPSGDTGKTEPSNDTQTDTKGTRSKGHKLNKFI